MELILVFAILCAAVWLVAGYARGWFDGLPVGSPALLALTVILVGSCFGFEFYHRDVGPIPVTLDRVLWGMLILQFGLLVYLRRTDSKPVNRFDIVIASLAIFLLISTFMHDWRYRGNMPMSRLLFFNLMPFGIYFAVKHSRLGLKDLKWIFGLLTVFGVYLAVVTIAEWRGWNGLVFPRYILTTDFVEFLGRGRGPFLNPVATGIYLVVCMSICLFWWPRARGYQKICIGLLTLLSLVGIYATLTRSVWVSAVLAFGIVCWIPASRKWKGVMIGFSAVAGAIVVALVGNNFNAFKRDKHVSVEAMSESVALRPMLAYVAVEMVKDKPVFGHGFGQYTRAKRLYHQDPAAGLPLKRVIPYMQHNVFLSYATEVGLFGMGLLISLLLIASQSAWKLYCAMGADSYCRQMGLLTLVIIVAFVFNGMFHDLTIIPMIGSLFYFVIGVQSNLDAQLFPANSANRSIHAHAQMPSSAPA